MKIVFRLKKKIPRNVFGGVNEKHFCGSAQRKISEETKPLKRIAFCIVRTNSGPLGFCKSYPITVNYCFFGESSNILRSLPNGISKPNLGGAAKVEREGSGSVYSANDYHPYLYIVLVVASTEAPFWRLLISAIHTYSM